MATTRIISMHVSHGKTIADCLLLQAAVPDHHRAGAAARRDRLSGAPVL